VPVHYAYPAQLAQFVHEAWHSDGDADPLDRASLEHVLTVAYQASLLRDEDRPVRVRLVVADPGEFDPREGPPNALTPEELRRLAIAAKYHRALVGIRPGKEPGRFAVWGMLQSGPGWIQVAQGGRGPAPGAPPAALVVRVLAPGRIAVGRGSTTLAELRGGVVGGPGMDVFRAKWLPASFNAARAELAEIHAQAPARDAAAGRRWAELSPEVVTRVAQAMVRRFIAAMVAAHHGGTVLVVPQEQAEQTVRGTGPLRLKYAFRDDDARRRYRRIILSLMEAIAHAGGAAGLDVVDDESYGSLRDAEMAALQDAIFEMSQLIAALSEADGAVVLTKRFELLGFGAEIAGTLPDVRHVARALDLEAHDTALEPLQADGTRHRSAYRFCARVPDAVAVVVSQDGGVRFVATHAGVVTFWDHAVEPLDL
jgi:broad specificity phosphatase PhoE